MVNVILAEPLLEFELLELELELELLELELELLELELLELELLELELELELLEFELELLELEPSPAPSPLEPQEIKMLLNTISNNRRTCLVNWPGMTCWYIVGHPLWRNHEIATP